MNDVPNSTVEINPLKKDLHEFFTFVKTDALTTEAVIAWYLSFHGCANWGQIDLVFNLVKRSLGEAGKALARHDVIGGNGEFRRSFLERVSPESVDRYFEIAEPPATKTELLAESENEWRDESLPKPINARLHLPRRPAFNLYEVRGHSLFTSAFGYQAFDPDAGAYWPTVSSRAFAKSIQKYPAVHAAWPIVLIQDSYNGGNFAHFLFDWLPRIIYFVKARPDVARECRFILGGIQGAFQNEVLRRVSERYAIPLDHFIFPTERLVMKLGGPLFYFSDQKEFIMHPLNMCHKTTISYVRELFQDLPKPAVHRPNLYVSRRDANLRKVRNEDALAVALGGIGYADITLGQLGVVDQMSLFAHATSIVAPHGMGLTHILFSPKDAKILELFNPKIGSDDYAFVAKSVGLRYRFLMGEPIENSIDYEIDVSSVMETLREMPLNAQPKS